MKTTILTLGIGTKATTFRVVHNLESLGFDIQKAFVRWVTIRKTLTPEMFCKYIRQRSDSFICLTEREAKFLNLIQ